MSWPGRAGAQYWSSSIPYRPTGSDGATMYDVLEIRQRCWAHILLEAKKLAEIGRTEEMLHNKLRLVFHGAKLLPPDSDCSHLDAETMAISQEYGRLNHRFGGKLARAAPDLFTFVSHPGMEPTNNRAERALRRPFIQRKIRHCLRTTGGMAMFGIMMTCMATWRMRGLNVTEKLLEALGAT